MNIAGSANNLQEATKKLLAAWEQTRTYWRDVKSEEFAARFLEHLPNDAGRAVSVMEEIDLLLKKVRRDCE
jgi:hypothetical protein